jgi:signal transduction histidine kinase
MLALDLRNSLLGARLLLLAMIWLLHGALLLGVASPWVHPLLLAHLGLFLLWQPVWRGGRQVGRGASAFILLAALVATFWLSWWAVAFWLVGLFGLVGSRIFVFRDRRARLLYLALMVYLLSALLLWAVPNVFSDTTAIQVGRILIWYVLPLLLVLMALIPLSREPAGSAHTVDFIYSLLLLLLLLLMVLGTLAYMMLGRMDYLEALLRTLFLIGLVLLVLGGLWKPRFGFSGLQVIFSRYLLNVGTPFENWLARLTEAARHEPDAPSYLRRAIALMEDFSWLSGLSWQSPDGTGQFGRFSGHSEVVQEGELRLTLYARQPINPTLLLHIKLLVQLLGYFYLAKQREQSLREITRLQAVYETGSRLTHDLTNMLQSLLALTSVAQSREERAQQLLQQQLPLLTQRIEMTVAKLKRPLQQNETAQLALNAWWDGLRQRNQYQAIEWLAPDSLPDYDIPAPLFDCIIDNLIDNALRKRQAEPGIAISIEIQPEPLRLIACDSGSQVPQSIAASLLRGAVVSENGLGIGLYQAARWADQLGYRLRLAGNQPGRVCFELTAAGRAKND